MQEKPLILTLRFDKESQTFFDRQRTLYFPPERNYLPAHLTLFHQLPPEKSSFDYLKNLRIDAFTILVTGLLSLGAGMAYQLESPELMELHRSIGAHFNKVLIKQDRQGFRPHITIQNKVTIGEAKALHDQLLPDFNTFTVQALGLDLWIYKGGPWEHDSFFAF